MCIVKKVKKKQSTLKSFTTTLDGTRTMSVCCGFDTTFVLVGDGNAFSFGNNVRGELGTGDTARRLAPTRVVGLPAPVRQVATGQYHTGIVTEAGDLFMCGKGECGQLGLGDEDDRTTPTRVVRAVFDGEAVLMVACGYAQTVVATEGGGVYTFGYGENGRLGHGDEEDQLAPRRVPAAGFNGERIVMVAAGHSHTVGLSEAGHVFTWGWNWLGQLGHGNEESQWAPRQVEPGWFGGEKVVFVAAGRNHTVAVTAGGRLYTWGQGYCGQLGHDDIRDRLVPTLVGAGVFGAPEGGRAVMAACGDGHTLVVTQEGALWACGYGLNGQLGLNDVASRLVFERVGSGAFGGARVVAAAAGEAHSAAVTEDGAMWTWGRGDRKYNCSVPTVVQPAGFEEKFARRWPRLSKEKMLAFAMATHWRLGAASSVRRLEGEVGLFSMILTLEESLYMRPIESFEGVKRLLGLYRRHH